MKRWGRHVDVVFGAKCPLGCGQRIFDKPADRTEHWKRDHGGDSWPKSW